MVSASRVGGFVVAVAVVFGGCDSGSQADTPGPVDADAGTVRPLA